MCLAVKAFASHTAEHWFDSSFCDQLACFFLFNNLDSEQKSTKYEAECFLQFNMRVCFLPQAARQAGLGRTVSNAVTAVMAECVTLRPAIVLAVWAGLVHTAIKVTHTFIYVVC